MIIPSLVVRFITQWNGGYVNIYYTHYNYINENYYSTILIIQVPIKWGSLLSEVNWR
jgi:hypothetical protein